MINGGRLMRLGKAVDTQGAEGGHPGHERKGREDYSKRTDVGNVLAAEDSRQHAHSDQRPHETKSRQGARGRSREPLRGGLDCCGGCRSEAEAASDTNEGEEYRDHDE